MAVWDSTEGMNAFEIKIHSQSTINIDTLSGVGILVGMNSTNFTTADGYLVIIRNGYIRVYDIQV